VGLDASELEFESVLVEAFKVALLIVNAHNNALYTVDPLARLRKVALRGVGCA